MNQIQKRHGFSLIELLLAIFILGIGIISIATLFPAGIAQQQKTTDDVIGSIVARNAMTLLRSKLTQDDFAGAEDFEPDWSPYLCGFSLTDARINEWPTVCGDWMWRRPGIIPEDFGDDDDSIAVGLRGAIDIFGTPFTDVYNGDGTSLTEDWTEREKILGSHSNDKPSDGFLGQFIIPVPGIPYNLDKYPSLDFESPDDPDVPDGFSDEPGTPIVRILSAERQYPIWDGLPEERPKARYYWDCMFRRYEGRILVAIFVYRVIDPSQTRAYTVDTSELRTPNMPVRVNLLGESSTGPWNAGQGRELVDSHLDDPSLPTNQWQYPGQWLVDQNGNVHNVHNGRRRMNDTELVQLSAPPSPIVNGSVPNVNWWYGNGPPQDGFQYDGVVTDIWFVPTRDNKGRRLYPVYATVEAL